MTHDSKERDQKWKWILVFGNIVSFFVFPGHLRSFGVFVVPIQSAFDVNVATLGSILTVRSVSIMISSLTAPALCDRFTERNVVVIASVIHLLSSLLVFFANHIVSFYVWAIVFGFCYGYTIIPTQIIIGKYFRKGRPMAMTILTSGGTLGQLILPPLCAVLMKEYSLYGTFLIVGAISFNCAAAGVLQRPLKSHPIQTQITINTNKARNTCNSSEESPILSEESPILSEESPILSEESPILSEESPILSEESPILSEESPILSEEAPILSEESRILPEESRILPEEVILSEESHIMHEESQILSAESAILFEESRILPEESPIPSQESHILHSPFTLDKNINYLIQNENDFSKTEFGRHENVEQDDVSKENGCNHTMLSPAITEEQQQTELSKRNDLILDITKTRVMHEEADNNKIKASSKKSGSISKKTKGFFQNQFDVSLLKSPRFVAVVFINAVCFGMFLGSKTFVVAIAKERSLIGELSLLITVGACTDIPGRIIVIMIVKSKILQTQHIVMLCNLLSAIFTCVYPLTTEYWSMMTVSAIMGLSSAANVYMALPIVIELVGEERMSKGLGWYTFALFLTPTVIIPVLGTIRDVTGSYDVVFYVAGGFIIALVFAYFIVDFIIERTNGKTRRSSKSPDEKINNETEIEPIHLTTGGDDDVMEKNI